MQTVQKKPPFSGERRRIILLLAAVAVLVLTGAAGLLLRRSAPADEYTLPPDTTVQLADSAYSDVVSITIRRGDETPWTAAYTGSDGRSDEAVTILGDDGFTLTLEESMPFLLGAACIAAEDVLTDNPAVYTDHLADYGLDVPLYEAWIVYANSPALHLRVGDKGPDGVWRYMLVDGDDRLFAFSIGSVDALFVNRDTLRKVSQPPLHKARMDRVTLTTLAGVVEWTLMGDIHDTDALDRWRITQPFQYPAEADAMSRLLTSAAGIHLGAYIGPATPERLTLCGFDAPRLTISIHMAAGTIAVTNAEGAAKPMDYPDDTLTFVIGGEKSDLIDYILFGDSIYTISRFNIGVFLDYDVRTTMSRYPVMTALGNLAKLTIAEGHGTTEYLVTRTEQVAANNELVTDDDGNVVYDVAVTCNGESCSYDAFAAAYNDLTLVQVSGKLPAGQTASGEPHTFYTFTDVDGTIHEVALATFDALHDAVIVNGQQAFYLIKGGFRLNLE